jgi:hypothetical protein
MEKNLVRRIPRAGIFPDEWMILKPEPDMSETETSFVKDFFTVRLKGKDRNKAELMLFDSEGNKILMTEFFLELTIDVRDFRRGRYVGFINSGREYHVISFSKE